MILESGRFGVLEGMVIAVDTKDRTPAATARTSPATPCGWPSGWAVDEPMRRDPLGGLLHDVGKIGIPDESCASRGG